MSKRYAGWGPSLQAGHRGAGFGFPRSKVQGPRSKREGGGTRRWAECGDEPSPPPVPGAQPSRPRKLDGINPSSPASQPCCARGRAHSGLCRQPWLGRRSALPRNGAPVQRLRDRLWMSKPSERWPSNEPWYDECAAVSRSETGAPGAVRGCAPARRTAGGGWAVHGSGRGVPPVSQPKAAGLWGRTITGV